MKRLLPVVLLFVGLAALVWILQGQRSRHRSGFPAPDFALKDLSGNIVRLSDFKGRVVFLNLWATWCPPCREEMPSMERLYRNLSGEEFVLLAVSEDSDPAATKAFSEQMGLTFPILLDPQGTLPGRYGVTGFPETFVISREGEVLRHFIGPEEWDSETSRAYFAQLLAKQPAIGRDASRP